MKEGSWGKHGCTSNGSSVSSVMRPADDGLLAPLCGVVEGHFAALLKRTVEEDGNLHGTTTASKTACEELATLLSGSHGGVVDVAAEEETGRGRGSSRSDHTGGVVVDRLLRDAAAFPSSFFYVHTQLPSSAVYLKRVAAVAADVQALSPLNEGRRQHQQQQHQGGGQVPVVAQLAGGLEPAVHFAVGSPLIVRCGKNAEESVKNGGVSAELLPFGHIQCLLRVRTKGSGSGGVATASAACVQSSQPQYESCSHNAPLRGNDTGGDGSKRRSSSGDSDGASDARRPRTPSGIVEPWKLGVSLDPKVPFYVRTMTERRPAATAAASRVHTAESGGTPPTHPRSGQQLGRRDCETYLLPQRELLFAFHAPKDVVAMCAAQNKERMRRQAVLGYSSPTHAFAEGPRTARRLLEGAYCNNTAAEEAAGSAVVGREEGRGNEGGNDDAQRRSDPIVYEVRALPGDVVYVPRGWTYTVERIIGTAVMHAAATSSPSLGTVSQERRMHDDVPYGALKAAFLNNGTGARRPLEAVGCEEQSDKVITSPDAAAAAASTNGTGGGVAQSKATNTAEVTDVEVDAFVLCYKPYPLLSEQQAAVYISANYVRSGIEEFYANGGNNVFQRYK
ncbi:hypothetical protein DQ04_08381000 [Trypanosoma grayi]|uniref:hypothetical protein n=1 Tax=Trypanosoma grayi TaxID=71804 RepID=UPI0004F49A09|nr:hypothetical protein DQ04_08381000 [Trypanosoma grayi]KEG07956.1 hypothetical protein DQ04_08381000 [Trypanosoma grayi]